MTTDDDIQALAGEYVLGTLGHAERREIAERRQKEPALDAAISDWERRLAPLNEETPAQMPPQAAFGNIMRAIGVSHAKELAEVADLAAWQARAKRWRAVALSVSAIAAALLVTIGLREYTAMNAPQQYVGVFAQDDVLPKFYLTIDLKARQLTIRPIDAKRQPGKSYQLWIASEQLGSTPQSLGLVDDGLAPTTKSLGMFDAALLQRATFGVSVENAGGSTSGRPSAGALHTKLLPVRVGAKS